MILLTNSNEAENKLDYVLQHMGSEEYLEYRERDGLTIDEAYQYLKRCEEQHLDWRTGRPISEDVLKDCTLTILKIEKIMMENKFHMVSYELDSFIRNIINS